MPNSPCQDCKRQVWQTACHHACTPLGDSQGCYGSRYPWRWWSSGWQSGVSDELIQNLIIWAAGCHPRVCLNCEPNTKQAHFNASPLLGTSKCVAMASKWHLVMFPQITIHGCAVCRWWTAFAVPFMMFSLSCHDRGLSTSCNKCKSRAFENFFLYYYDVIYYYYSMLQFAGRRFTSWSLWNNDPLRRYG